jgi:hypothetical protein
MANLFIVPWFILASVSPMKNLLMVLVPDAVAKETVILMLSVHDESRKTEDTDTRHNDTQHKDT